MYNHWSHNSNFVCYVKSILVTGELNVCLLKTFWGNKSVNLFNLDFVELLNGLFDHFLVWILVYYENQGIIVFNIFNCTFAAQWVLNHVEEGSGVQFWYSSQLVLWVSLLSQCLWSSECSFGPQFCFLQCVSSFFHCGSCGLCNGLFYIVLIIK